MKSNDNIKTTPASVWAVTLQKGNPFDTLAELGKLLAGELIPYVGLGIGALDIMQNAGSTPYTRAEMSLRMSQSLQYRDSDLITVANKLDELRKRNYLAVIATERILGIPQDKDAKSIFESSAVMSSSPRLQTLVSRLDANGQLVIPTDELKSLFVQELAELGSLGSNRLALVKQLVTNQAEIYRYMTNVELRALNQQLLAENQPDFQRKIQAANATVYILSTFTGFIDPKLGREMQVVGSSAIQMVDALDKYAQQDALSSAIFTGNMLSAAISVAGLFSDDGPSPDEIILEEIGKLREALNQVRSEMHERFDRVDTALNAIYTTVTDRLNRIDLELGKLNGNLSETRRALLDAQANLHRLERKVFAFLDAGFRRDLNEQLNLVVGYRETFGDPIPWNTYLTAENKFFTWAVLNSKDELSSGSAGRSYDDASLLAELNAQPMENNLNYLDQYLTARFASGTIPPFAESRLANPRDWSIAANAYLELAMESPMFFRRIAAARLESIRDVGLELSKAVQNVALVSTRTGVVANTALFKALVENYRAKAYVFGQVLWEKEVDAWKGLHSPCDNCNEIDVAGYYIRQDIAHSEFGRRIGQTTDTNEIAQLTQSRDGYLAHRRGENSLVYNKLVAELNQVGDVTAAGNSLSGAKALLEAFINLGFSQSMESDDFLRSFLYGGERILDLELARELYVRALAGEFDSWPGNRRINIWLQHRIKALYPDLNPDTDRALSGLEIIEQRLMPLESWISNRLNQVEIKGKTEPLRMVDATLTRIDAFRAARLSPIPSPSLRVVTTASGQTSTSVTLFLYGENNVQYSVEYSENLREWFKFPIRAERDTPFTDGVGNQRRFYRSVLSVP